MLTRRAPLVLIGRSGNLAVFNLYCVRKESQSELPRFLLFYKPLTPLSYISLTFESPFLMFGFLNFLLVLDLANCFLMAAAHGLRLVTGTYI